MHQTAGQGQLADTGAGPVDDLRRQDAADARFLAETEQHNVDAGAVDFGQFREVADAHEHGRLGVALAHFQVASQRGGEAEADRLQNRVEAERHAPGGQLFDGVVQPCQRPGHIGQGDNLTPPVARCCPVAGVDAQHQFRTGPDGGSDFDRVETIDADAQTLLPQLRLHGVADAGPTRPRVATQVDQVGAIPMMHPGLGQEVGWSQTGRVVDLGEDGDVVCPPSLGRTPGGAEMIGQVT